MEHIYSLLLVYKYVILFPLVMVGGPIVPVIAASFASFGLLNVYFVYIIALAGVVLGDTIYYWLGRIGRHSFVSKYGHYLGITEKKIERMEGHFKNHLGKTLLVAKITEATVVLVLVAAGVAKVDFRKFLTTVTLIEIFKILTFVFIGFYFGKYYILIKQYLDTSVAVAFAIMVMGALGYWFFGRKKTIKI